MSDPSPRDLPKKVIVQMLGFIALIVGIVAGLAEIFDAVGSKKLDFLFITAGALFATSIALFVILSLPSTSRRSVGAASISLLVAGVVMGFATRSAFIEPSLPPSPTNPTPSAAPTFIAPTPDTSVPRSPGSSAISAVGQITKPGKGEQIPIVNSVGGIARGVVSPHELWLFVEFLPDGPLFPGEGAIPLRSNDEWIAPLYVGGPGQAGQQFVLHLADLGPGAIARLQAYIQRERDTGDIVGLSRGELDALDVVFLDAVTVNRI